MRNSGHDPALLEQVRSLLEHHERPSVLDRPAWVPANAGVSVQILDESLSEGSSVGCYRIERLLGTGGMGVVYRARDLKLGRTVALKVLRGNPRASKALAVDQLREEARILARLNHPLIAAIHGLEDACHPHALVMEYVEGTTLGDRLAAGGALPLADALSFAGYMIDALEAAHEQGIVHGDFKPANIKLRSDGSLKVLDFGLARVVGATPGAIGGPAHGGSADQSPPPAVNQPLFGTPGYVSPEQLRGECADVRSDIWQFGCVLFEMLSGHPPFVGHDIADTLRMVREVEPDWSRLPIATPPSVRRLLPRLLQKERRHRLAAIADARFDLQEVKDVEAGADRSSRSRQSWTAWIAATVGAVALAALAVGWQKRSPASETTQFVVAPPPRLEFGGPPGGGTGTAAQIAVSPDGRTIAFIGREGEEHHLWLRPLGSIEARKLPGTENAAFPFWSPDSNFVGFFAAGKLRKIRASGGPAVEIADTQGGRGATWNRDGVIVFTFSAGRGGLRRVEASGGEPTDLTSPLSTVGETNHRFPHFLPDGHHFLYTATSGTCCPPAHPAVVKVGSLDPAERQVTLFEAESSVVYAAGYLFFRRGTALMAQPFDAARLELSGEPVAVADAVDYEVSRYTSVSASPTGTLVYVSRTSPAVPSQLTWMDRDGGTLDRLGDGVTYESLALSPDEQSTVVSLRDGEPLNLDLYLYAASAGGRQRLTRHPGDDSAPVWSPDGRRIAYANQDGEVWTLHTVSPDGLTDIRVMDLLPGDVPTSWSSDGRYLALTRRASGSLGVWALPLAGGDSFPIVDTVANERSGIFSPDGRWLAFSSDEQGQNHVFVRPFPGPGPSRQVSRSHGDHPLWRPDGGELFFLGLEPGPAMLTSIPASPAAGLDAAINHPLFATAAPRLTHAQVYAVTRDGGRVLANHRVREVASTSLTVTVNWRARPEK